MPTEAEQIAYLLAHGWKQSMGEPRWYEVAQQQEAQELERRGRGTRQDSYNYLSKPVMFYSLEDAYNKSQQEEALEVTRAQAQGTA